MTLAELLRGLLLGDLADLAASPRLLEARLAERVTDPDPRAAADACAAAVALDAIREARGEPGAPATDLVRLRAAWGPRPWPEVRPDLGGSIAQRLRWYTFMRWLSDGVRLPEAS